MVPGAAEPSPLGGRVARVSETVSGVAVCVSMSAVLALSV
jgi:hypothetical protein